MLIIENLSKNISVNISKRNRRGKAIGNGWTPFLDESCSKKSEKEAKDCKKRNLTLK